MKKIFILGLGVSGKAAAHYFAKKGYEVIGFDDQIKTLNDPSIILKNNAEVDFSEFEYFVPSPGIARNHPIYQKALASKINIIGEAEIGLKELCKKHTCIAVTGTNGKTTVVKLIEHILNESGLKAKALGNIGSSLVQHVDEKRDPKEIIVAELSSFQIETMHSMLFDSALILNITPNHLDRHLSFEEYAEAKCRLAHCLKKNGKMFIHESVGDQFKNFFLKKPFIYGITQKSDYTTDKNVAKKGENIVYFLPDAYKRMGMHDSENVLAAWLIVEALGVDAKQFGKALNTFSKPSHRIEFVAKIKDVAFYDDSKATSTDAVEKALQAMSGPVILILGGKDKNISFGPLKKYQGKIKKVLAMGSNREKIFDELFTDFEVEKIETLREVVDRSFECAKAGDCVLLSPGSSSFDQFRDYAERGEKFKQYILEKK